MPYRFKGSARQIPRSGSRKHKKPKREGENKACSKLSRLRKPRSGISSSIICRQANVFHGGRRPHSAERRKSKSWSARLPSEKKKKKKCESVADSCRCSEVVVMRKMPWSPLQKQTVGGRTCNIQKPVGALDKFDVEEQLFVPLQGNVQIIVAH